MKELSKIQNEKISAAFALLTEDVISLGKFQQISTLLKGFNPKIDKHLETLSGLADKIQKIQSGDIITLSAESLPEKTDKDKKRKKLLLLFIQNWKDLKSEVERICNLQSADCGQDSSINSSVIKTGKLISGLKGPLGLITVAAVIIVGIAAFINSRSVTVNVTNTGCRPFEPVTQQSINLPGLKLPNKTIASGNKGVVVMPGINLTVDETIPGKISLTALSFSQSFDKPYEIKEIIYDGQSLSGKKTVLKLSSSKSHEVIIKCTSKL